MARTKKPCKNHPERLSARRCFHCKEYICSECQVHIEKHIFCGRWCFVKWKISTYTIRLKKSKVAPLWFLLGFVLFTEFLLFLYFNRKLENHPLPSQTQVFQRDSLWFQMDSAVSQLKGKLTLRVKVPQGTGVVLWKNGQPYGMQAEREGKVQFTSVALEPGANALLLWALKKDGTSVLLDSVTVIWKSARLDYLARSVSRVPIKQKLIALTFDAGSTDRGSREILQILKEKKLRCTIFVTGAFVKRYPDLVRQIKLEGHEIANHTLSHPHLTQFAQNFSQKTSSRVDQKYVTRQLQAVDSLFYRVTQSHLAPYWRAPFGEYNKEILRWAAMAGFKHIRWSSGCDALDWTDDSTSTLYRSANQILEHFLRLEERKGLNGAIILMHLGTNRKTDFPYLILPALIDSLRQRSYQFVTVTGLLNAKARQHRVIALKRPANADGSVHNSAIK